MKITAQQRRLLEEAQQRFVLFGDRYYNDLQAAWTGLGYYSDYKPVLEAGLMKWVYSRPSPRCLGWLRLTPAGAEIVQDWIDQGENTTDTDTWQGHYELCSRRF